MGQNLIIKTIASLFWGKATGFEATRPDVCSLTSTAVVITENPDVAIYHAVKLTLV